jgi:hypothetical protein
MLKNDPAFLRDPRIHLLEEDVQPRRNIVGSVRVVSCVRPCSSGIANDAVSMVIGSLPLFAKVRSTITKLPFFLSPKLLIWFLG